MRQRHGDDAWIDAELRRVGVAEAPDEVELRLKGRMSAFRQRLTGVDKGRRWLLLFRQRRVVWAGASVAVLAVPLAVVLLTLRASVGNVYAAMIEALRDVRTVHIVGCTTSLEHYSRAGSDEVIPASSRYPYEMWQWVADDGRGSLHLRNGPVVEVDDGELLYEYNEQNNHLWSRKSQELDDVAGSFAQFREQVEECRALGARISHIGERRVGGRLTRGVRVELLGASATEWWSDSETDLRVQETSYKSKEGEWSLLWEFTISYNEDVPASVASYAPPTDTTVTYYFDADARFEKWNLHLRQLGARYIDKPLPEKMELVPRLREEEILAYVPARLPGINSYRVVPITGELSDSLRSSGFPSGALRVPKEVQEIRVNYDLIVRNNISSREQTDFVLAFLRLEVTKVIEEHKVWTAHYDGRPLKPSKEVTAPVPNPSFQLIHPGMAMTFGRFSLKSLFDGLMYYTDSDLQGEGIIIIDETGLPSGEAHRDPSLAVSSESPFWKNSPQSLDLAKRWFEEEFGVTFTEEVRPVTIYVIRKKQGAG